MKKEVISNRAIGYYHDNIGVLREKARNKYRGLSEEEKNKKENTEEIDIIKGLKKLDKKAKVNYFKTNKIVSILHVY